MRPSAWVGATASDGIAGARVPGVILGDERVAHLLGSLDDPAQGIEAAEPLGDPAVFDGGDGVFVGALLAKNFGQHGALDARLVLEQPHGVAARDGAVLAGVAREQQAAARGLGQGEDLVHILDAHLPRFVDPQHVAPQTVLQHLVVEQVRHGLRVREALLAQDIARLGAGREGEDLLAALGFDFFCRFLHEGAFALARAAANHHEAVPGLQDIAHGGLLPLVEPVRAEAPLAGTPERLHAAARAASCAPPRRAWLFLRRGPGGW